MPIKAVLFDLGDTLIRNKLTTSETFQKILEHKGIHVTVEEVEKAYGEANQKYGSEFQELAGKIPLSELYTRWDTHVLDALGVEDDGNLAREVNRMWFLTSDVEIFPDVNPALTMLRYKGVKTGIVSNAYEEEVQQLLEIVGLNKDFFDLIVGADTIKRGKPDPEIFMYAVKKLRMRPEEAIFVGNSVEKDYRGAERVGMSPLLIERSHAQVPEKVRYVRILLSLKDYLE